MGKEKSQFPPLDSPEAIELEFKRMQIEVMREQMQERQERKDRLQHDRERRYHDFLQSQRDTAHRQRVCQHRKGGRDNKFAKGNAADYSVIMNTYPDGSQCVSCTRCGKEVWKPKAELRKSNPKLFREEWELWLTWSNFPTDNTPSGSKIFEITRDAA